MDHGAAECLVKAMQAHPERADVQHHACWAIGNLAVGRKENRVSASLQRRNPHRHVFIPISYNVLWRNALGGRCCSPCGESSF